MIHPRNSLPYTSDAKLNFERTVEILGKTIRPLGCRS